MLFHAILYGLGAVATIAAGLKSIQWMWPRFLAFLRLIITSDQLVRAAPGLVELSRISPALSQMTQKMNGGNGWIDQVSQLKSDFTKFRAEQTDHNMVMEEVNHTQCRNLMDMRKTQIDTNTEISKLTNAVAVVTSTYVPRSEHEQRWEQDDQRLSGIEHDLRRVSNRS